ncbi:MAG: ergothioneine biosynthesis protein EgtB [Planctomycetota bacterium]
MTISADPLSEYRRVRQWTESLCEPLETEDYVVQSMDDVSPTKWHLAHVSWFFETFILKPEVPGYQPYHPDFEVLFNSYYDTVGEQYPRPRRGHLSRPTVAQIFDYRRHVDRGIDAFVRTADSAALDRVALLFEVGLHHEQQHQELLLMDIKHVLGTNPLRPSYLREAPVRPQIAPDGRSWFEYEGGRVAIGFEGSGFSYDNESPRHDVLLRPFRLASQLVTAEDYQAFMADGGYERPELWLSDGWTTKNREGWRAPLYWFDEGPDWSVYTLAGPRPIEAAEPVCHVSYYEADAFATWAGARLPLEAEWEIVARELPLEGNFVEKQALHPLPSGPRRPDGPSQMFGDVWEWTSSSYAAYPGYRAFEGALGEYNGKFMCSQQVLRGGACVTPQSHMRPTYRNFFYPHQRWQFSGIRLASSL